MSSLAGTLAWCAVQVGILAGLGVAAAWALGKRSPAAAARAAAAAAGMVAIVTLLAPAPMPRLTGLLSATVGAKPQAARATVESPDTAMEAEAPGVSLGALVNGAARVMGSAAGDGAEAVARAWVILGIVTAGALLGVLRLLAAWRYVVGLRRRAVPVECGETQREFAILIGALGIRRAVALCESPAVVSPAVIGWRRPTVLLPAMRSTWSAEQLRAALAHELAHIVRGDFFWRVTASVAQAIHFYHPLVHWLVRRLALVQELAADRLAAAASGGAAVYVRALSELAIGLDEQPRLRAEPLVLPTFSSHLIRRITMLRSKEGTSRQGGRQFGGAVAVAAIVLVGVGTIVLRSSAEAVEESSAASGPAAAIFQRAPIDPSIVSGLEESFFALRLGELAERAAFAPLVEQLNASCRSHWKQVFGAAAPVISFEAVEFVAGVPQLTLGPMPEEQKKANPEATSRMMFGCGELVIRFKHEVAWRAWVDQYMPLAEDKTSDGFAYVEFPPLPLLGPASILLAARDDRTLVLTGGNLERLRAIATSTGGADASFAAAQWNALDGGLATLLAGDSHIDRKTPTPEAPQLQAVLRDFQQLGMAFDLDAASNVAGVRFDLVCADQASAERVRAVIEDVLPLAKEKIAAELENPTERPANEEQRRIGEFWLRAIHACTVRLETLDDGTARVRLAATAAMPDLWVKQDVAEKETAPFFRR